MADHGMKHHTTQPPPTSGDSLKVAGPRQARLAALANSLNSPVPVQRAANKSALPPQLQAGVEALSGLAMDHVRVHYNSARPAQIQAHAYAQGTDIHVAPGQERHLPHEAWHVVQQAQGRVQPTTQLKKGIAINDDKSLEQEADMMGAKAMSMAVQRAADGKKKRSLGSGGGHPVQRQVPTSTHNWPKPDPQAGSYIARGGKEIVYEAAKYPRSNFSFGSKTRYEVFARYNPQYVGSRIVSIRASHGEQVNVEGVQLDHQVSWDSIAQVMNAHNVYAGSQNSQNINDYYTLWDAKMYYNDESNLVPALGALNAAAGAGGVDVYAHIHPGVEIAAGKLQTSWMNLQAGITSVGQGMSDEVAERVATSLLEISANMNQVTDQLF